MGNFLARNLEREVPIEVEGRAGTARLNAAAARGRQRRYYFEVRWDGEAHTAPATEPHDFEVRWDGEAHTAPATAPPTAELAAVAAGWDGEGNGEDWG
jgi:hypothetical protein